MAPSPPWTPWLTWWKLSKGERRPYAYGLALGGEEGVLEVLRNLVTELDLQMALSGCRSLEEMRRPGILRASQSAS